ncbi:protein MIS12 homolog [Pocillopora verrucosa]|uniref:protein MIS12 homolog n=1 Tax=Pocillopora verrucosa TaxID=203993 RepID=UPI0027976738|nr:protein MIS12 homolog [Pocillopora verrucosa]
MEIDFGKKSTEYDYETQFFGFTPESFVDGVYNAVNDYVGDCIQELENVIKSEPSVSCDVSEETLHRESEKMIKGFYKSIDAAFDRFEVYVKNNIFKIPANILLPEDKVHHKHQCTVEDEKQIDEELKELERKIKAAKYVNAALRQEVKDLDSAQEQLDNFENHIDAVQKAFEGNGGVKQSLTTTHEKAIKLYDLIADGLHAGTFHVQEKSDQRSSTESKQKKIKLG